MDLFPKFRYDKFIFRHWRLILSLIAFQFFFSGLSFAVLPENVPVSDLWLQKHRSRIKKIGSFDLSTRVPPRLPFGFGGAKTSIVSDALVIRGRGKADATWEAILGDGTSIDWFQSYSADLDADGQRDGIISFRSSGSGPPLAGPVLADNRFILLFDDQRLPVPFATQVWFEDRHDDMLDFVDMNGNGAATLLDQGLIDDN